MDEQQHTQAVRNKLDDIRGRLLGEPSTDELHSMQLHLDALEKLDRVTRATMMKEEHHHHHMDDHDDVP
jgi:hypothetical protein